MHLPSSRAQQPSLAALSAAEQQSSIPVECVLHNTINTLTAVRTVKTLLQHCQNMHHGKLTEIPQDFRTESWNSIDLHHLGQL